MCKSVIAARILNSKKIIVLLIVSVRALSGACFVDFIGKHSLEDKHSTDRVTTITFSVFGAVYSNIFMRITSAIEFFAIFYDNIQRNLCAEFFLATLSQLNAYQMMKIESKV